MNLTLLLHCCFLAPIVADAPAESVAVVNVKECFRHVPSTRADRAKIVELITEADAEARMFVEEVKELESLAERSGSSETQRVDARLLKFEFGTLRRREQQRIKKAESEMFQKWRQCIDAAVKQVAERDNFTIVLYIGEDRNGNEGATAEFQQMIASSHIGFMVDQDRTDITARIVAQMSTAASMEEVERDEDIGEQ